jgi:uncharacterized protein (TIGR03067 family)
MFPRLPNHVVLGLLLFLTLFLGRAEPQEKAKEKQAPAAKAKTDQERLQGTWRVVSAELGGQKWDATKFPTYTFRGDRIIVDSERLLKDGSFVLDPKKDPKWIDFKLGEFVPSRWKGLYEFRGEQLFLDFPNGIHGERPTILGSAAKPHSFLTRLERILDDPKRAVPTYSEARRRCGDYLNQLGFAMHAYLEQHEHFPMPAIYSRTDGKPLLSWRVALLPHIGQEKLYKEFKLDEPWDSDHNIKLLLRIPKIYAPLGKAPKEAGVTYYQVFVGKGAVFEERKQITIKDVADGTSMTILIMEAGEAVPWTKPADIPYDPAKPIPKLGGMLGDGYMSFTYADGSSLVQRNVGNNKVLHAAITRNDGELFSWDDF